MCPHNNLCRIGTPNLITHSALVYRVNALKSQVVEDLQI